MNVSRTLLNALENLVENYKDLLGPTSPVLKTSSTGHSVRSSVVLPGKLNRQLSFSSASSTASLCYEPAHPLDIHKMEDSNYPTSSSSYITATAAKRKRDPHNDLADFKDSYSNSRSAAMAGFEQTVDSPVFVDSPSSTPTLPLDGSQDHSYHLSLPPVKALRLSTGLSAYFSDHLILHPSSTVNNDPCIASTSPGIQDTASPSLVLSNLTLGNHVATHQPSPLLESVLDYHDNVDDAMMVMDPLNIANSVTLPLKPLRKKRTLMSVTSEEEDDEEENENDIFGRHGRGAKSSKRRWASSSPPPLLMSGPLSSSQWIPTRNERQFERQQKAHQILRDLEGIPNFAWPSSPSSPPLSSHLQAFQSWIEEKLKLYNRDLTVDSHLWKDSHLSSFELTTLFEKSHIQLCHLTWQYMDRLDRVLQGFEQHQPSPILSEVGIDQIMDQILIACQLCGNICQVFRRSFPPKASFLMSRLSTYYLSFLISSVGLMKKSPTSYAPAKGSEARLVHVFQNAIYLLKSLKHANIGQSAELVSNDSLLRAILELGLGLCEQVGAMGTHVRRSRVVWMLHWVTRYLKNVIFLDPLSLTEKTRLQLMVARLPDS